MSCVRSGRGWRAATSVWLTLAVLALLMPWAVSADAEPGEPPVASAETEPVPSGGDAADDPAIWVHPTDPAQSVVIGTDKLGGLGVYDLTGAQVEYRPDGRFNNVDLRDRFVLGGRPVSLVVATETTRNVLGVYMVDAATRRLVNVAARPLDPGVESHGICLYRSARSGKLYAFVAAEDGEVAQLELVDDGAGKVNAVGVRGPWDIGASGEACVADDDLGVVYLSEESEGWIWRYGAEPDASTTERTLVDEPANGHVVPETEGMAIARTGPGQGFLISSVQANSSFAVYRREAPNAFVGAFTVAAGPTIDGCEGTDGIDLVGVPLGPAFPHGLFVCQDNDNPGQRQNFKLVPLEKVLGAAESGAPAPPPAPAGGPGSSHPGAAVPAGFRLADAGGGVFAFGGAPFLGSLGAMELAQPVVGMSATRSGKGYWLVASDGGVFAFGDAAFLGSTGALRLVKPIVGMSATPTGKGYWLVASDGGVFAFGDAGFFGSTGGLRLVRPIVGMAPASTGRGYWLVASDGGVFAFGDAAFLGSTGNLQLAKPIVGMSATPTGRGYWMVASDGGIFTFGDAAFEGSSGSLQLARPIVGMAPTSSGKGYWMMASDGGVFSFGDAAFLGSAGGLKLARPIVAGTAAAS